VKNPADTETGGVADRRFPETSWSILARLGDRGSPAYLGAQERLLAAYWKPVYGVIRFGWGKSNEDAKDLTQQFFTEAVLDGTLVEQYDASRGSFRAFLKAALANFLRDEAKAAGRQKRGGGVRTQSLAVDDFDLAGAVPDARSLTPEQLFDATWRNVVLARALERVEQRLRGEGKEVYFEVFRRYDLEPDPAGASYQTVGDALGLRPDTVKNYLTRARRELRHAVTDLVSDYVESEEDLASELEALFGA
jgi:RNA polymerase sigma factor (sigma-70 family)